MRRFKFRLEAVLKHRTILEERCQQAFAKIQSELTASQARLTALDAEYRAGLTSRSERVDVEDLTRRERYQDALRERITQEERVREGIVARLEESRTALVAARQAREAIERVRKQDYEEHLRVAACAEQERLDEIATLRHGRQPLS